MVPAIYRAGDRYPISVEICLSRRSGARGEVESMTKAEWERALIAGRRNAENELKQLRTELARLQDQYYSGTISAITAWAATMRLLRGKP